MTHSVKIYNRSVSEVLDMVREMETAMGLTRNQDFRWAWHPKTYDPTGWHIRNPAHAEFQFNDAAVATFVELKYQS